MCCGKYMHSDVYFIISHNIIHLNRVALFCLCLTKIKYHFTYHVKLWGPPDNFFFIGLSFLLFLKILVDRY